jgi:hypothetical protein
MIGFRRLSSNKETQITPARMPFQILLIDNLFFLFFGSETVFFGVFGFKGVLFRLLFSFSG